jgi:hypothetical protein
MGIKFSTNAPSWTKTDFDLNPVDDGFKGYVQVDHHISRGRLLQGLSLKYTAICHTGAVLYR